MELFSNKFRLSVVSEQVTQSDLLTTLVRYLWAFLFLILTFSSCGDGNSATEMADKLLATVHNKSLHLSDMTGMFPRGTTAEDSTLIINAFVERWIREAVLLHEAERNVPQDLNIDELVRDYRASLIKHNYEQVMVNQLLDSTITQQELTAFYEKNKEQYQLETPIVRCFFIKVPRNAPNVKELETWWKNSRTDAAAYGRMVEYCNIYAVAHVLEDTKWTPVDEIAQQLPAGTITVNNVGSKKDFTQRDDDFIYFFKAFEVISRKEIAPLSYIEDQASKVILRQRQLKLLKEKKEEMYEREIRKNTIKVYTE
ncbi:MAG: hypothetical protein AB8G22_13635 [Saprospiraceae bacterium]